MTINNSKILDDDFIDNFSSADFFSLDTIETGKINEVKIDEAKMNEYLKELELEDRPHTIPDDKIKVIDTYVKRVKRLTGLEKVL